MLLCGVTSGQIYLYDNKENKSIMEYHIPDTEELKEEGVGGRRVIDICFSPGEDVFLVHRADGKLCLFGQEEP